MIPAEVAAEIERGPQEIREVRGEFPEMYVSFVKETPAQFATRIALLAAAAQAEQDAKIAHSPHFSKDEWRMMSTEQQDVSCETKVRIVKAIRAQALAQKQHD